MSEPWHTAPSWACSMVPPSQAAAAIAIQQPATTRRPQRQPAQIPNPICLIPKNMQSPHEATDSSLDRARPRLALGGGNRYRPGKGIGETLVGGPLVAGTRPRGAPRLLVTSFQCAIVAPPERLWRPADPPPVAAQPRLPPEGGLG